jgi:hypothetical protein
MKPVSKMDVFYCQKPGLRPVLAAAHNAVPTGPARRRRRPRCRLENNR